MTRKLKADPFLRATEIAWQLSPETMDLKAFRRAVINVQRHMADLASEAVKELKR
jgi:hypothetical protein